MSTLSIRSLVLTLLLSVAGAPLALAQGRPTASACSEQITILRGRYRSDFPAARTRGLGMRSRTILTHQSALHEAKSVIEGNAELMAALRAFGGDVAPFHQHGPEATVRALTAATASRVRSALNDPRVLSKLANYSEEDMPGTSAKRGLYRDRSGNLSLIRDRIRVHPGLAGLIVIEVTTTIQAGDGDAAVEAEREMQIYAGPEGVVFRGEATGTDFSELQVNGYDPQIASESEFLDLYLAADCPRPLSPPSGSHGAFAPSAPASLTPSARD